VRESPDALAASGMACYAPPVRVTRPHLEGVVSLDANKTLVRHYIAEIYRGNLDIIDEVISEGYVGTAGPNPPAQYKANNAALRRAFPDIQVRFDAVIAEGDWVAVHCTIEGTHLGEWRGIPPTGKHATWTGTAFRRVRDGKVVRGYATFDWLSVLQQIGAIVTPPSPETPTASEERPSRA
jgi:predicted ester cyclase